MQVHTPGRLREEAASLPYLTSFVPSFLVLAGNLLGGWYAAGNVIFSMVILVVADWLLPADTSPARKEDTRLPDVILLLGVLLHTLCLASLLYGVYSGRLTGPFIWLAAVSTGINAGAIGIVVAHELVHRKQQWLQNLGIWNLFLAGNPHFYTEHRLGHHFRVGTWDDPATARYNESYYRFVFRTLPGQWLSALAIEAKRLRKQNRAPYSLRNFVVRATVLQAGAVVCLFLTLGSTVGLAYLVQAAVAMLLLEFVNYIEHYGLVRAKGEKVGAHHAWQSDRISSRFTLFELSRHSDHHLKSYKPFHTLDSHESPFFLPSGYFGMYYVALIPPLWFRIMNPIIEKHQQHSV